jgi:signal transduction histidine kinase
MNDLRRERLALVGQLVGDLSHDCNNLLAYVLSNLQNLVEYADELVRLVASYRERVQAAGLSDPALAQLESEMDLPFVLEDAGRAAREGLAGANRLRDVLRTLARLGAEEPGEPQRVDLAPAVRQAAGLERQAVAARTELALEVIEAAPALVPPPAVTRAVLALIQDALTAFGDRARADNRLRIALEPADGGYVLTVEHNGGEPGNGAGLVAAAARELGGEIDTEPGRTRLYIRAADA